MASNKGVKVSPTVEPIKLLAQVLESELVLKKGRTMLGLENYHIPKTNDLYIALLYGTETPIGNSNYSKENKLGGIDEVQEVTMIHSVSVEAMSFNSEARLRKEEILQAVNSTAAAAAMEKHNMRINQIPDSFVRVPDLEPGKQLNRYQISFNINAIHRKTKPQLYYDNLRKPEVAKNA